MYPMLTLQICIILVVLTVCAALLLMVYTTGKTRREIATSQGRVEELMAATQQTRVAFLEQNFASFVDAHADATIDYLQMARKQFEDMHHLGFGEPEPE